MFGLRHSHNGRDLPVGERDAGSVHPSHPMTHAKTTFHDSAVDTSHSLGFVKNFRELSLCRR